MGVLMGTTSTHTGSLPCSVKPRGTQRARSVQSDAHIAARCVAVHSVLEHGSGGACLHHAGLVHWAGGGGTLILHALLAVALQGRGARSG